LPKTTRYFNATRRVMPTDPRPEAGAAIDWRVPRSSIQIFGGLNENAIVAQRRF
jgi:hypothetical protein